MASELAFVAKALRKPADPHVPTSLTRIEPAVELADATYEKAERAAREREARKPRRPALAKPGRQPADEALADAA